MFSISHLLGFFFFLKDIKKRNKNSNEYESIKTIFNQNTYSNMVMIIDDLNQSISVLLGMGVKKVLATGV